MQGRLSKTSGERIQSFPIDSWKKEFQLARKLGFESIEWIFDDIKPNPILNDLGISEIKKIKKEYSINVNSVCADFFMTEKIFNENENNLEKNIDILKKLILSANNLEIDMIELPFVDSSSIKNEKDKIQIINNLRKIFPLIDETGISILLETDLNPLEFVEFLKKIEHPKVFANYDSGNSASLGYKPKEELEILKSWIKNIHIKDRVRNGHSVPLGTGDTNFESIFNSLFKIGYSNDLIIQGSRILESKYSPEKTCEIYIKFVKEYLTKYYI